MSKLSSVNVEILKRILVCVSKNILKIRTLQWWLLCAVPNTSLLSFSIYLIFQINHSKVLRQFTND